MRSIPIRRFAMVLAVLLMTAAWSVAGPSSLQLGATSAFACHDDVRGDGVLGGEGSPPENKDCGDGDPPIIITVPEMNLGMTEGHYVGDRCLAKSIQTGGTCGASFYACVKNPANQAIGSCDGSFILNYQDHSSETCTFLVNWRKLSLLPFDVIAFGITPVLCPENDPYVMFPDDVLAVAAARVQVLCSDQGLLDPDRSCYTAQRTCRAGYTNLTQGTCQLVWSLEPIPGHNVYPLLCTTFVTYQKMSHNNGDVVLVREEEPLCLPDESGGVIGGPGTT